MKKIRWISLLNSVILYAPVAYMIRLDKGLDGAQIFLLQAVMAICVVSFEVPFGYLSDRFGYKVSIVISQVAMVLARIVFLFGNGFYLLLLDVVLLSVSDALQSGVVEGYIYEFDKIDYTNELTKIYNYSTIGFMASNVLFFFVVKTGNFWLIGVTLIFNVLALLVCFRLPSIEHTQVHIKNEASQESVLTTIRNLSKITEFWECSVSSALIAVSITVFNMLFVMVLDNRGFKIEYMGVVILIYSGVELLIRFAPWIRRKLGRKNFVTMIFISLAITFFIIGKVNFVPILLIVGAFIMLLSMMLSIEISEKSNNFIDNVKEEDKRATLLSVFNMSGSCVEVFLFFAISNGVKSYENIFIGMGVVYILIAVYSATKLTKGKSTIDLELN